MSQEIKLPVIAQIKDADVTWEVVRNSPESVIVYLKTDAGVIRKTGAITLSAAIKWITLTMLDEVSWDQAYPTQHRIEKNMVPSEERFIINAPIL
jgi:hypothetical protein